MKSFEVENIKKGNIELYEQLFKHYYENLVHFAFRYVKDKQGAEDVVQDVFVFIWNNKESLDFTLNFKSYLYMAVKHQALKHINYTNKFAETNVEIILEKKENSPDSIAETKEFTNAIAKAISELPERRKEIFQMHRFDNLTYSEIASTLNLSIKTVETQISRSLKFLREQLSKISK